MEIAKLIGIAIFAMVILALAAMILAKNKKKEQEGQKKELFIPEDLSDYYVNYVGLHGIEYGVFFTRASNGPHKGEWTSYCWREKEDGTCYKSHFKREQTKKFIKQLIEDINKKR